MAQIVESVPRRSQGLSCIFNAMAADVLAMHRARASAAMILTYFLWNILVWASKGLRYNDGPIYGNFTTGLLLLKSSHIAGFIVAADFILGGVL